MDFDLRISFEIEEGLYTLALSEYQPNTDIPITVVEIVLELEKHPLSPNPLKVFSYIIWYMEYPFPLFFYKCTIHLLQKL